MSTPEYEKLRKELKRQVKAGVPAKDLLKQLDEISDENLRGQVQEEITAEGVNYEKRFNNIGNQLQLQIQYFKNKVAPLKSNKENKITGIQYLKELRLAGKIAVNDVAVVKQQGKDRLPNYLVVGQDAKTVATIGDDFSIQIDETFLQQYEGYIGKLGEQTEQQKDFYDYDKEYKCEQVQEQEESKKKGVEEKKKKLSHTKQHTGEDIVAIVEIQNKSELAAILDTDIPSVTNAYIVKFEGGATKICLEQGETVTEIGSDIHTQQIEKALGETMNLGAMDGTKLRANEFRAAEKEDSDKQLIIIDPEHSGTDKVIESDGSTGRVRSGEFVKNANGKMVELKGSVLYPQNIQMETDMKNYVMQEPHSELDDAIESQMRLELLLEAARIKAEIDSIRNSDINVKDKHNMLNEKRRDLEDVLSELGMDYEDVEEELEAAGEDVPDVDDPDADDGRSPGDDALDRLENHGRKYL